MMSQVGSIERSMAGSGEKKDDALVLELMDYSIEMIMKITKNFVSNCSADDEETIKDKIAKLEGMLLQILHSELVYTKTVEIVDQVVEELDLDRNSDDFHNTVDSIEETVNNRLAIYEATLTESVLKSHPKFLRLKGEINALLPNRSKETETTEVESVQDEDDDDNDEYSHQEVIPDLDPVSKQPLTDPVRNIKCRHIYGKAAMLQLIKKNPRTRCPAMGCGNTAYVTVSHLIDDPVLTARVTGQPLSSKTTVAKSPGA